MTTEPDEAGWRALAEQAVADIEPSELTDRRILKKAARIAAARRATPPLWRRFSAAIAASVAVVALGVGYVLMPMHPRSDAGVVEPADAGSAGIAPTMPQIAVPLQFARDGVTLLPVDQDQIDAAASQIDPCGRDVRLRLDSAPGDALAGRRADAVAAALAQISGGHCHPHVVVGRSGAVAAGDRAVLIIAHADRH